MPDKSYDVRHSTCQGGGGLWAFLSHIREVKEGENLVVTTEDALAQTDIPAWTEKTGWKLTQLPIDHAQKFIAQRPA